MGRGRPPKSLNRAEEILKTIVEEYLHDGCPVGSRTIARRLEWSLSPATIRNVMADLEEEGYLEQLHTSSGRVPTASALRKYINEMMSAEPLDEGAQQAITDTFESTSDLQMENILLLSSQALSYFSNNVSLVLLPQNEDLTYSKVEFVSLSPHRVLALFVSQLGVVTQRIISIEEEMSHEELNRAAAYLTEQFSGLTLAGIERKTVEMIRQYELLSRQVAHNALLLARQVLPLTEHDDVLVGGTGSLLSRMTSENISEFKELLATFENRTRLVTILKKVLVGGGVNSEGVTVAFGAELAEPEFANCSIVSSVYTVGSKPMGVLSVVGPNPLPYARISSLVSFMAREVNKRLQGTLES